MMNHRQYCGKCSNSDSFEKKNNQKILDATKILNHEDGSVLIAFMQKLDNLKSQVLIYSA